MSWRCHLIPRDNLKWHQTKFHLENEEKKTQKIHAYLKSNNMQSQDSTAFQTKRNVYILYISSICVYISILFVYLLTHSKLVLTFFGFLLFFDLNFIERKTKHTLSHISSIIRSTRRHYSTQMPGVVATEYTWIAVQSF